VALLLQSLQVCIELVVFLEVWNVELVVGGVAIVEAVDQDGVDCVFGPVGRGGEAR